MSKSIAQQVAEVMSDPVDDIMRRRSVLTELEDGLAVTGAGGIGMSSPTEVPFDDVAPVPPEPMPGGHEAEDPGTCTSMRRCRATSCVHNVQGAGCELEAIEVNGTGGCAMYEARAEAGPAGPDETQAMGSVEDQTPGARYDEQMIDQIGDDTPDIQMGA